MEVNLLVAGQEAAMLRELKSYKKEATSAAKDLCYGPDVITTIKNAKSISEITNIMKSARNSRD